jgi:hypothetical protein
VKKREGWRAAIIKKLESVINQENMTNGRKLVEIAGYLSKNAMEPPVLGLLLRDTPMFLEWTSQATILQCFTIRALE